MSISHDIAKASRQHKPTAELRKRLIAQTTEQLDYENSAEHAIAMHMQSLTGSLTDLCKTAGDSQTSCALVKRELTDIELAYTKLGTLILALHGVTNAS